MYGAHFEAAARIALTSVMLICMCEDDSLKHRSCKNTVGANMLQSSTLHTNLPCGPDLTGTG